MITGLFGGVFMLAYFALAIWVTYMFYRALARIGEELSYIRSVLQQRLPPAAPEPATRRPDPDGAV
jgi:hypothetical protein